MRREAVVLHKTLTELPTTLLQELLQTLHQFPICFRIWGFAMWYSAENLSARSASFREESDEEEALKWAALERLPTYKRVRKGIFKNIVGDFREIDVEKLEVQERKVLLDRLVSCVEDDCESFFERMRRRFDA